MTRLLPKKMLLAGLVWAMLCLSSPLLATHPYHVSFAEVEWNPKTGNFEVALCVWPADLEKSISEMQGRPIDLDAEPNLESAYQAYVSRRFRIVGDSGKTSPIRWVGSQVGLKQAWLYFEVAGDKKPGRWTIENRVFYELNDDQLNQIQVKVGPARKLVSSTIESKPIQFETDEWSRKR